MKYNTVQNRIQPFCAAWGLIWLLLSWTAAGAQNTAQLTQDEVNTRVHQMMRHDLEQGVFTTQEGVRATRMRTDTSLDELKEIKQFGERAIAPLSEYLASTDYRAQHLAVNLLGAIGGSSVIKPLSYAAEHSGSSAVRLAAVANLGQQPWRDVATVIKQVSASDPDLFVRKKAAEIIARQPPPANKK